MKFKIKKIVNLIFLILIINTNFSNAHDSFNGGCENHCTESIRVNTVEKKLKNINEKNQVEDNYSCLNKSLCRG